MARIMHNLLPPTGEFYFSCCGRDESPCGHGNAQVTRVAAVEGSTEHGYVELDDVGTSIPEAEQYLDDESHRSVERMMTSNRAAGL